MGAALQISVVVPTRDRCERLARMLEALRAQTLAQEAFDVVVVDDGSRDGTPELLAGLAGPRLKVLRHDAPRGSSAARNAGWRAAGAPVVAFTDDDCRPHPRWLEAGLRALNEAGDGAFAQGVTEPDPEEADGLGPFSRSLCITHQTPWYETCNMLYPRVLLERAGGFDEVRFGGPALGGEDTDLAWRAIRDGARCVFAPEAKVWHAVHVLTPHQKLHCATRWTEGMAVFAAHPQLRRELEHGLFWTPLHYHLIRTLLALLLPGRWALPLKAWCLLRYAELLVRKSRMPGDGHGGGPRAVPFYLMYDLVETATVLRASLQYRTLVL